MNWTELSSIDQLEDIKQKSFNQPQVIFKHSTRCSISSMAKSRLERSKISQENIPFYFLDLIEHRNISNNIAQVFDVEHASPQVLVIKNGECIYDESHSGISMDEIVEQAAA
jgi:bacillithiol system protein YtxJ